MNKQGKGKIGWCDWTWNPISGLCPVDCRLPNEKSYCYARRMYQRFKWDIKIESKLEDLDYLYKLQDKNIPDGARVFVCSTIELFHPRIEKKWRDDIFSIIEKNPKITFQILTKMPEDIDRPMPENVHLGVSCDGGKDDFKRLAQLGMINAKIRFASYEPLLGCSITGVPHLDWGIIGRLTGHGKKYDPKRKWIIELVEGMIANKTTVFLKDNLIPIMGEEYVMKRQKFPGENNANPKV